MHIKHEYRSDMGIILALLVIWVVLALLGFVIKGLIWLAIVGLVLLAATVVYGFVKGLFTGRRVNR